MSSKSLPNSLEGHFSHINRVTSMQRGLSKVQKEKVINSIMLASSVAPSEMNISNTNVCKKIDTQNTHLNRVLNPEFRKEQVCIYATVLQNMQIYSLVQRTITPK